MKVYASNAAGREVVLNFHGPGELRRRDVARRRAALGVRRHRRAGDLRDRQPHAVRDFLAANPDFAQHLIRTLIRRARSATENVKSLALSDVYGRLVRLVNALAVDVGGRLAVRERLTHQDIADRVGASRDMVGKLLKDLVAGGYLLVEDRQITILKKLPPGW